MGITRSSRHKRRNTGGHQVAYRKKRKFELGRQPAMTKIGAQRVHLVRTRGGNTKFRALRLDQGNITWPSEAITRKTRILRVVYNASNNDFVRTNTLVKNSIIQVDATPFRQWYERKYGVHLGRDEKAKDEDLKVGKKALARQKANNKDQKIAPELAEQFAAGRLYVAISSRPGQSGRADGYILEGRELEFYVRKMKSKK